MVGLMVGLLVACAAALHVLSSQLQASDPTRAEHASVCADRAVCTPIAVLFGTSRQHASSLWGRIEFGDNPGRALRLGRTVVTIPERVVRQQGQIVLSPHRVYMPKLNKGQWWDSIYPSLPGPDPARHFTISATDSMLYNSPAELRAELQSFSTEQRPGNVLLFVHGAATTFEAALYRTGQLAYDMLIASREGSTIEMAILFSWPSVDSWTSYIVNQDRAIFAQVHLEEFLRLLLSALPHHRIHLLATGMGVDPLLRALKALVDRSTTSMPNFGELVLMAPDVPRELLEHMVGHIRPLVKGTTLYVSSNDRALSASRAAHGEDRAGAIGAAGPLIVPGVDTIDVTALDTDYFTLGHSTYGERKTVLSDIAELLARGARPPNVRMPIARAVQTVNGTYWRYEP